MFYGDPRDQELTYFTNNVLSLAAAISVFIGRGNDHAAAYVYFALCAWLAAFQVCRHLYQRDCMTRVQVVSWAVYTVVCLVWLYARASDGDSALDKVGPFAFVVCSTVAHVAFRWKHMPNVRPFVVYRNRNVLVCDSHKS
jgi:hypothetical protein